MAIRGRTPEKGQGGLTFTHDKCRGDRRTGWLSGDVHVLECHVGLNKASKPCAKVLLGPNAECEHCGKRPIESLGYVPLRDQTGKPVCVVVRKERILFVSNLERGSSVYYGREAGQFESVYVIPSLKELEWDRYFTKEPRDDMGYWLPRFLGVPHLEDAMRKWFDGEQQCQPVVTDALPPTTAELEDGGPVEIGGEGVHVLGTRFKTLDESTARLRAKQEREKKNAEFLSKNGKPK